MQYDPRGPLPCITIDNDAVCYKLDHWEQTQATNGGPGEGSVEWEEFIRQLAEEHPSAVVSESEDERPMWNRLPLAPAAHFTVPQMDDDGICNIDGTSHMSLLGPSGMTYHPCTSVATTTSMDRAPKDMYTWINGKPYVCLDGFSMTEVELVPPKMVPMSPPSTSSTKKRWQQRKQSQAQ